jgi:hypothetical protein
MPFTDQWPQSGMALPLFLPNSWFQLSADRERQRASVLKKSANRADKAIWLLRPKPSLLYAPHPLRPSLGFAGKFRPRKVSCHFTAGS